jgi:hypothetical protein
MVVLRLQPFSRSSMAHTLRRSCPPHTRITRKSGNASSSPTAKSPYTSTTTNSPNSSYFVSPSYAVTSSSQARSFHSNVRYLYATKDAQDKDSLKPRATEYSKSGSDDAAAHDDAAFDPNQTKPETERKNMGESGNSTVRVHTQFTVSQSAAKNHLD